MTAKAMRFFLDEGVPRSVGLVLQQRGHLVIYLKDAIATGSSDLLVCAAAEANDAILVACDGDMKQIAKNNGVSNSRYSRISLVKISCNETQAAKRLEQFIDLVENEWIHSSKKASRRIFVEIGTQKFTIFR